LDAIKQQRWEKSLNKNLFIMLILLALFVLNTEYPAILLIAGNTTLSLSAFKVRTKTKAGDDYILEAKVDKTTFFLGDTVNLTITFKAKKSLSAINQVELSILLIAGNTTLSLSAFKVRTMVSPG
jgi:hypothetical protein